MDQYGVDSDQELRLAYGRFLNSPLSEDVEPNSLLHSLVGRHILNHEEAEMVHRERNLPARQLRLFMAILPLKGKHVFNEMAPILNDCGHVESARHWQSFLMDEQIQKKVVRVDGAGPTAPTRPMPRDQNFALGFEALVMEANALSITPVMEVVNAVEAVDTFRVVRTQGLSVLEGSTTMIDVQHLRPREFLSAPKRIEYASSLPNEFLLKSEEVRFNDNDFLGDGGFGEVFSGQYRNRPVAVKQFRKFDPFTIRMFRAEASNMAALTHDNIVQFIGFVFQPDLYKLWLVMECVQGGSLRRFCHPGAKSPSYLCMLEIAKGCLLGLEYMHQRSCCHRDISPENILASDDAKQVKISDFGLSEFKEWKELMVVDEFERKHTRNFPKCKWMYAPPEMAKPGIKCDWLKGDIYSMGATLAELFSGQYFWNDKGKFRHSMEITAMLSAQLNGRSIDPDCLQNVRPDVRSILKDAIRPDYENRKSPTELLSRIQKLLQKEGVPVCSAKAFLNSVLL